MVSKFNEVNSTLRQGKNIYMKILTSLAYFSVIWQRMPQNFFPLILMNGMS